MASFYESRTEFQSDDYDYDYTYTDCDRDYTPYHVDDDIDDEEEERAYEEYRNRSFLNEDLNIETPTQKSVTGFTGKAQYDLVRVVDKEAANRAKQMADLDKKIRDGQLSLYKLSHPLFTGDYNAMIVEQNEEAARAKQMRQEKAEADRLQYLADVKKNQAEAEKALKKRNAQRAKARVKKNSTNRDGGVIIDAALLARQKARAAAKRERKRKEEEASKPVIVEDPLLRGALVKVEYDIDDEDSEDEVEESVPVKPLSIEIPLKVEIIDLEDVPQIVEDVKVEEVVPQIVEDVKVEEVVPQIVEEETSENEESQSDAEDIDEDDFVKSMTAIRTEIKAPSPKKRTRPTTKTVYKPMEYKEEVLKPQPVKEKSRPVPPPRNPGEKTRMCNTVFNGVKCTHRVCRFAHNVSELTALPCRYGMKCRNVYWDVDHYVNSTQDHYCEYWHPEETNEAYGRRLGVPEERKPQTKPAPKPTRPAPMPKTNAWKR